MYLTHTKPDLVYVLSVVSQFMHSPSEEHMNAVNLILRYLKSSPGKGILFKRGGDLKIEGYTDADWAGSIEDRRSTSGYFTFIGGNFVIWRSKKQEVVARSSAEAEYRGMIKAIYSKSCWETMPSVSAMDGVFCRFEELLGNHA
ncbi:secreted RxLR effector protein 161-like [Aristolochia californica]|uniref:secreted RxLR effector protein 161-like n=1 Tax=Aristolochia californica TaxID=171875 RepID=UPI0035DFA797